MLFRRCHDGTHGHKEAPRLSRENQNIRKQEKTENNPMLHPEPLGNENIVGWSHNNVLATTRSPPLQKPLMISPHVGLSSMIEMEKKLEAFN